MINSKAKSISNSNNTQGCYIGTYEAMNLFDNKFSKYIASCLSESFIIPKFIYT